MSMTYSSSALDRDGSDLTNVNVSGSGGVKDRRRASKSPSPSDVRRLMDADGGGIVVKETSLMTPSSASQIIRHDPADGSSPTIGNTHKNYKIFNQF